MSKRDDLMLIVDRLLAPHACVQGVVAVGSVDTGTAGAGSDIDVLVFMDPLDEHIVPAESIWAPWDDTFHSIFTDDQRVQKEGMQLDALLCDMQRWSDPAFEWSEGQRAGLAEAWIAFDRTGAVGRLIGARTRYDDATRIAKLDEAIGQLEQLLLYDAPERAWDRHGPLVAHDRLAAAYDALAQGLFALNRRWRFWRQREMTFLLRLPWLPRDFEARMLVALNAPSLDHAGYLARAATLREMFDELLAQLQAEGVYGDDPIGEAFVRKHAGQPGRVWNMAEWNAKRRL